MRRFFNALAFLSTLPSKKYEDFEENELGKSMAFFPLVGLILGSCLLLVNFLLSPYLSASLLNILLLALLVLLTGGIHLDGLMDVADGLGGGNNKDKVLSIMRDSRVGSFGVLSAVFLVMIKWEALSSLAPGSKWAALILMPVVARWGQVFLSYISPFARKDGLGRCAIEGLNNPTLIFALITALIISWFTAGLTGLGIMAIVSLFTFIWSRVFIMRLGGITGDIIGALSELLEVLVLLIFIVAS